MILLIGETDRITLAELLQSLVDLGYGEYQLARIVPREEQFVSDRVGVGVSNDLLFLYVYDRSDLFPLKEAFRGRKGLKIRHVKKAQPL